MGHCCQHSCHVGQQFDLGYFDENDGDYGYFIKMLLYIVSMIDLIYALRGTKENVGSEQVLSECLRGKLGESAERVEDDSAYKLK